MTKRILVVHKEHGVFLGTLGVNGLFSLLEHCGVYQAVTFFTADSAKRYMCEKMLYPLTDYDFLTVDLEGDIAYVDPEQMVDLGLTEQAIPLFQAKRDFLKLTIH